MICILLIHVDFWPFSTMIHYFDLNEIVVGFSIEHFFRGNWASEEEILVPTIIVSTLHREHSHGALLESLRFDATELCAMRIHHSIKIVVLGMA